MKCIKCGHGMVEGSRALTAEVRGEHFAVEVSVPHCPHCGRVVLKGKSRRVYERAAADAFRKAHKLLTAVELHEMRRSLGMTWMEFAEHVGVGIATLKRWIGGEIQTPSMDRLVRLQADLAFMTAAKNDLLARLIANADTQTITAVMTPVLARRPRRAVEYQMPADNAYGLAA